MVEGEAVTYTNPKKDQDNNVESAVVKDNKLDGDKGNNDNRANVESEKLTESFFKQVIPTVKPGIENSEFINPEVNEGKEDYTTVDNKEVNENVQQEVKEDSKHDVEGNDTKADNHVLNHNERRDKRNKKFNHNAGRNNEDKPSDKKKSNGYYSKVLEGTQGDVTEEFMVNRFIPKGLLKLLPMDSNILKNVDAKFYHRGNDDGVTREYKHFDVDDQPASGIPYDRLKDDYHMLIWNKPTIRGMVNANNNMCYIVKDACYKNEHFDTSIAKISMMQFVHEQGILTYSGCYESNWLNNTKGKTAPYITFALNNGAIIEALPGIKRLGLSVLATIQFYQTGTHFGEQYSYVCDGEKVVGMSRGKAGFWCDENLPKDFDKIQGAIGDGYYIHTLARIGNQRIIVLDKIAVDEIPIKYNNEYVEEVDDNIMKRFVQKKNNLMGLNLVEMQIEKTVRIDPEVEDNLELKLQWYWRVIDILLEFVLMYSIFPWYIYFLLIPLKWVVLFEEGIDPGLILMSDGMFNMYIKVVLHLIGFPVALYKLAVLLYLWYKGGMVLFIDKIDWDTLYIFLWNSPILTLGFRIYILFRLVVRLVEIYFEPPNIDLRLGRNVHLYGKHAKDFFLFMQESKGDQLPWGFYYVDCCNIIRLPQGHSKVNYTNLFDAVIKYNMKCGHQVNSAVVKFYDLFGHVNLGVATEDFGIIQEAMRSKIVPITTMVSFRYNPQQERPYVMWQLVSESTYLEYCAPTLDEKTVIGAASNRLLQTLPLNRAETLEETINRYMSFYNKYAAPVEVPDEIPVLDRYTGRKFKKYLRALESAGSDNPFYSTFLKNEALPVENLLKKPVRIITPNTPKFNVTYLNFFHEFETMLLQSVDYRDNERIFAKGLNLDSRGSIIAKLCSEWNYVIPIDFKNFDAHHRGQNYEAEMWFYNQIGLPASVSKKLIKAHKSGCIDVDFACRCSGDLFTGSGNCLAVASLLAPFFDKCRILCDGDDTLIFTNNKHIATEIIPYLYERGYELTCDEIIDCKSDQSIIPFCQVNYDRKGVYTKDPVRILSKAANVTLSINADPSHLIYGKLQGLAVWSQIGVNFEELRFITQDLIDDVDPYSVNWYKMQEISENADRGKMVSVHLTGLFLEVCQRTSTILKSTAAMETLLHHVVPRKVTRALRLKVLKEVIRGKVREVVNNNSLEYLRENFGSKLKVQRVEISYLTKQVSLYGLTQFQVCTSTTDSLESPSTLYHHIPEWLAGHTQLHQTIIQSKEQHMTASQKCQPSGEQSPEQSTCQEESTYQEVCSAKHQATNVQEVEMQTTHTRSISDTKCHHQIQQEQLASTSHMTSSLGHRRSQIHMKLAECMEQFKENSSSTKDQKKLKSSQECSQQKTQEGSSLKSSSRQEDLASSQTSSLQLENCQCQPKMDSVSVMEIQESKQPKTQQTGQSSSLTTCGGQSQQVNQNQNKPQDSIQQDLNTLQTEEETQTSLDHVSSEQSTEACHQQQDQSISSIGSHTESETARNQDTSRSSLLLTLLRQVAQSGWTKKIEMVSVQLQCGEITPLTLQEEVIQCVIRTLERLQHQYQQHIQLNEEDLNIAVTGTLLFDQLKGHEVYKLFIGDEDIADMKDNNIYVDDVAELVLLQMFRYNMKINETTPLCAKRLLELQYAECCDHYYANQLMNCCSYIVADWSNYLDEPNEQENIDPIEEQLRFLEEEQEEY
jgi:hypothetical protein